MTIEERSRRLCYSHGRFVAQASHDASSAAEKKQKKSTNLQLVHNGQEKKIVPLVSQTK